MHDFKHYVSATKLIFSPIFSFSIFTLFYIQPRVIALLNDGRDSLILSPSATLGAAGEGGSVGSKVKAFEFS